jgi:hypothetical protein
MTREFDPADFVGATAFLEQLPESVHRIYVDVWTGGDWRFVVGDDRKHAPRTLARMASGVRFRIRVT